MRVIVCGMLRVTTIKTVLKKSGHGIAGCKAQCDSGVDRKEDT